MKLNSQIRDRRLGLRNDIDIDYMIDRFKLKETYRLPNASANTLAEHSAAKGPLACARLNSDTIAVANEDGYVNLLRLSKLDNIVHWMAHENAIFDIKAGPDQERLITASGDATLRLWDVTQKKEVLRLNPHFGTIKSVSIYDKNIIASGSRDGTIKVHDLRLKNPTIIDIRDAHRNLTLRKTIRRSIKTDPISCVTNVVFDPHYPRLYSSGANDATIKLWDLRKLKEGSRLKRSREGIALMHDPYHEVHHPSKGMHCGYAHLVISSNRIYAACSDNKIYCYNDFCINTQPTTIFTGLRYDNCLRLGIMDDRLMFCGSKGGSALIWSLGRHEATKEPIGKLSVDDSEHDYYAIETDWDSLSVVLLRDDSLASKWTIMG